MTQSIQSDFTQVLQVPQPRPRCSLLRVLGIAALAGAMLFGMNYKPAEPAIAATVPLDFFRNAFDCTPGLLQPSLGSSRVKGTPLPHSSYPSRMQHPGIVAVGEGKMGYSIDEQRNLREEHSQRISMMKQVRKQLKDHAGIAAAERRAPTQDTKGFLVGIQDNPQEGYLYALSPAKLINHQKATREAESLIADISALSEEQIGQKLLAIHSALMKGIEEGNAGQYRDQPVIVFKDTAEDRDRSPANLAKLIRKYSPEGKKNRNGELFKRQILPKWVRSEDLNPEEHAVASLLGYIPPSHREVPSLMREYVKNLKSMADQMKACPQFDPVAFASFAHQGLGRIHPFGDGNGRMGRLLMNAILQNAGYAPVVFKTDEEYTAAVISDGSKPGAFAQYLREKAIPWTEKQFGADRPCLKELSCD